MKSASPAPLSQKFLYFDTRRFFEKVFLKIPHVILNKFLLLVSST